MTNTQTKTNPMIVRSSARLWHPADLLTYPTFYALSVYVAFLLRYRLDIPAVITGAFWLTIPVMVLIKYIVCLATGEWKLPLRSANGNDMRRVLFGATVSGIIIYLANASLFTLLHAPIPRSVIAFDWILTIGAAMGLRILLPQETDDQARTAE